MITTPAVSDELRERIRAERALPSPPVVMARLIELGEDPDANLSEIIEVLNTDAVLVARLIRLANSPLYAGRRRTDNLRQAVIALGLDAVLTASLSLTLLSRAETTGISRLFKQRCWTRSVHAAACAQRVAGAVDGVSEAEAFLAGLLQDIGVQVVSRLEPTTYLDVDCEAFHADAIEAELAHLAADHALVGAELLEAWGLPDRIVNAVRLSHAVATDPSSAAASPIATIAAIGGFVADGISGDAGGLDRAFALAESALGLDGEAVGAAIDQVLEMLPDLGEILNAQVPPQDALVQMAHDLLVLRQAKAQVASVELQAKLTSLTSLTEELRADSRLDPLTGLSNRRDLDAVMSREFFLARDEGFPMSLLFIDMDDFKRINDRFGHRVGDELLIQTGQRIGSAVRDGDHVGRFGGEEFVVVLPGADRAGSEVVASRLIDRFRRRPFLIGRELSIKQTISIGVATLTVDVPYSDVSDFLHAADQALYAAKHTGKDRWQHAGALDHEFDSRTSAFVTGDAERAAPEPVE